jgi:hypothetical protein
MAAGAVGAPGTPGPATVEPPCLLDVLGLRKIDPARDGRVGGCVLVRAPEAPMPECSTILSIVTPRSPKMLPWPVGDGNWVSLKSVDADSKLLWRSSKLTDGRKSKDAVVGSSISSGAPFLPPKENREWLLADDALNIGASAADRRRDPIFVGLALSLLLEGGWVSRLGPAGP